MLGLVTPHHHGGDDASPSRRPETATPQRRPRDPALAVPDLGVVGEVAGEADACLWHAAALLMPGRAGCPALGPGHGGRLGMPQDQEGQAAEPTNSARLDQVAERAGSGAELVRGGLAAGGGHAITDRPEASTLGAVGERGSHREGRSRSVPGSLRGLVQDPAEVVGSAVDDRHRDHAGYLEWVVALGALDDLRQEAAPGPQRDPALGLVVDLALPAVDGADGMNRPGIPGGSGEQP
jgi:hypothetical protein